MASIKLRHNEARQLATALTVVRLGDSGRFQRGDEAKGQGGAHEQDEN